ncbi:hypothetical protein CTAYLR_002276 [Chrysophaeum taylorii]|uniref:RING-CH-type domain-containing protein n=1 Tax=Chrysophaeum taylorii TaxID=2483200 RepID=A0AAD7XRK5_9STRA|nr:hypothetical protein CTAYLR_002276 [Chrysophaeum taylorii]
MKRSRSPEPECRYCFESEGELVPDVCNCRGAQRFVHLDCLRKWQRMVLVSQPTHPMAYDDDLRQQRCNVCQAEFRCEPPSRYALMASFTGPRVAELVKVGSLIASRRDFDDEDEEHWRESAYLITKVEASAGVYRVAAETVEERQQLREKVVLGRDGETRLWFMGKAMRIARGNVDDETLPLRLTLEDASSCDGDDMVAAVNLSRLRVLDDPRHSRSRLRATLAERKAWREFERRYGAFPLERARRRTVLEHYIGGPVAQSFVSRCVVFVGDSWLVLDNLVEALAVTVSRRKQPKVAAGDFTRLCLPSHRDLDGKLVQVLRQDRERGFGGTEEEEEEDKSNSKWLVRLAKAELCLDDDAPFPAAAAPKAKILAVNARSLVETARAAAHLERREESSVVVYVFWGYAAWSRVQLLAETARGHWGLCRADLEDLERRPSERRRALEDRLVFAPITAMTDSAIAADAALRS